MAEYKVTYVVETEFSIVADTVLDAAYRAKSILKGLGKTKVVSIERVSPPPLDKCPECEEEKAKLDQKAQVIVVAENP